MDSPVSNFILIGAAMPVQTSYHWMLGAPHPWLIWTLLIAVAVMGWWSYRKQSAGKNIRKAMGLTRVVALAVVALLLGEPALVRQDTVRDPSVIAVWVDTSLSMTLRDQYNVAPMIRLAMQASNDVEHSSDMEARPTRFDLARSLLNQAQLGWLEALAQRQQVALFTGSTQAQLVGIANNATELSGLLDRLSAIQPDGISTDVPAVVAGIFQNLQGRPISAVILLTDGRSTTGSSADAARALARVNVTPLFATPIGMATEPFNLALEQIAAPHNAFVQDPLAVTGELHVTGATKTLHTIVHLYKQNADGSLGNSIADQPIDITPSQDMYDVHLLFRPDAPGDYRLAVKVDPIAGQLTDAGNQVNGISTHVVDTPVKVLYVDGYPRWEYRYVKNDLVREKTVLLSCLLLSADDEFAQEGTLPIARFPETQDEMNRYDVLILGDVDPNYFSDAQINLIVNFVGQYGGGFGMIAGQNFSPWAYAHTPLAALLPVLAGDQNNPALAPSGNQPFVLHLTPAGKASMLFHFFDDEDENLRQISEMPPMYWFAPVLGLQPSAEVLADLPSHNINGEPAPLIVFGRYGEGQTMFSAIDDTWRWRYYHGDPLFQSYWLEMIRLLARSRVFGAGTGLELQASADQVQVGQDIQLFLRLHDPTLANQMPETVQVQIQGPGGEQTTELAPQGADRTEYQGDLTLWQTGRYTIAPEAGSLPGQVQPVSVSAVLPNWEFDDPRTDVAALENLTAGTGGRVIQPPQMPVLQTLIADRSVETIQQQSTELWNKPLALGVLVLLLTVEWVLRKRAGLI
ncbi:MAG TPA: hypothetical protein VMG59_06545 [Phycisphaerae bacterium]|nr:hypothetical protein [Phycisphaerae bacterium]